MIVYLHLRIPKSNKIVMEDGILKDEERNTSCPHLCYHLEVVSNLSKGVTSVSLRDLTVNSHLSSDIFPWSLGVDRSSLSSLSSGPSCFPFQSQSPTPKWNIIWDWDKGPLVTENKAHPFPRRRSQTIKINIPWRRGCEEGLARLLPHFLSPSLSRALTYTQTTTSKIMVLSFEKLLSGRCVRQVGKGNGHTSSPVLGP